MTRSQPIHSLFTSPAQAPKFIPRLAVSLDGLDKCGKSHWALMTTPEPICLVVLNDNLAVYNKALESGRKIPYLMHLDYPVPDPGVISSSDIDKREHEAWKTAWRKFKSGMEAIKQEKTIRTLVWDTASELWHLAELAHFGKLRGNARIDLRTELNGDFSGVFWDLYKSRPELNMVLVHKAKKQYETVTDVAGNPMKDKQGNNRTEWNGKYERDGYNNIGFNVDMTVQAGWDGKKKCFYTRIDENNATRYGAGLSGTRWDGDVSGFVNLALETFPETEATPEIWGL